MGSGVPHSQHATTRMIKSYDFYSSVMVCREPTRRVQLMSIISLFSAFISYRPAYMQGWVAPPPQPALYYCLALAKLAFSLWFASSWRSAG